MTPITTETWLRGLESGKFKQAFGFGYGTYKTTTFGVEHTYCALSVGIELTGGAKIYLDNGTFIWNIGDDPKRCLTDYPEVLYLDTFVPGVAYAGTHIPVAWLNDIYKMPFKRIADLVRRSVAACREVE